MVLVGALAVAGFLGLAAWLVVRGDDQSGLTRQVEVVVIGPHEVGSGTTSGYLFDYAYRADGAWYGEDRYFVNDRAWKPGAPILACLDPQDPSRHVLSISRPCGQERTNGNSVKTATPRPAPRQR